MTGETSTFVTAGIPITGMVMSAVVAVLVTWSGHGHQRTMAAQERRIDLYLELLRPDTIRTQIDWEQIENGSTGNMALGKAIRELNVRLVAFASREVQDRWENYIERHLQYTLALEEVLDQDFPETNFVPPEHEPRIEPLAEKSATAYRRLVSQIRKELGAAD